MNQNEAVQQNSKPRRVSKKKGKALNNPPVKRLLLPTVVYLIIATQIPFIVTIYYSFQEWNLMRPDKGVTFTWFTNFIKALSAPSFYEVAMNTLILTTSVLMICFVCGLLLALLMNRNFVGKGIVRTMFISPFFVMPTVSGIIWKTMVYNPSFGFSAYFANVFGVAPYDWFTQNPLLAVIFIISWMWIPFFMLILLAGLQSLPMELIEAAQLDGANRLQQFFNVTIPHLVRYIEVVVLLGLMFILQVFGEIYVTTSGGPGFASTNLSFLVYRTGFQSWDVGGASAIGVITVILTIVMMLLMFKVLRRMFKEEQA
ncbi:carbohydrate ABC transporter permease [Gracilibacillus kekensis]|uniref:Sorbitol/mannitol transport system permease protein n=1 Tax=Gracilibacillus kekensis TaxID=1027249 RepID=A0A1M7QQN0_9BACI|nr:sugar ABC transporter permease [Gracilibacillus kekensis]SHN33899.1 sorbitol/mannitol transport system permease protein [Gracilibacillus kekensis]